MWNFYDYVFLRKMISTGMTLSLDILRLSSLAYPDMLTLSFQELGFELCIFVVIEKDAPKLFALVLSNLQILWKLLWIPMSRLVSYVNFQLISPKSQAG